MAFGFKHRIFPTERHQAILDCIAEDVTPTELATLLRIARLEGVSELDIGKIRIHYDAIIDDPEKAVRQHFGIDNDYSIVVRRAIRNGGYVSAQIDGLPAAVWALLYAPDRVAHTPQNIGQAIKALKARGMIEDAERIKKEHADILSPPPQLTEYQLKLLNDPDYLPDSVSHVKQAIRAMRKRGLEKEANEVGEKYAWFINDEEFREPLISAEEARAILEELMKH